MKRLCLLALILFVSCKSDTPTSYLYNVSKNDSELSKPIEGEWLSVHDEKGQTFEEFKEAKPILPSAERKTIYLKPIGDFNALQEQQIELTRQYLEVFFQLKVVVSSKISNNIVPENKRRIGAENNEQLLASYILDSVLVKQKPKNAIVMMGISSLDLYPSPEWNYVFGLASFENKVGVTSIFRLQDQELKQENFDLCLTRLLKISSHEIGHMFSLHHCIDANCVMNGTNNIPETDKNVSRLCSKCQRKLYSSIKYDNRKRLSELIQFFKKNHLNSELAILEKDWENIN